MNKYFAILGRSKGLSLYELTTAGAGNIEHTGSYVLFSIADEPMWNSISQHLGGVTKRGVCIDEKKLKEVCNGTSLVGVNDKSLGVRCKKEYGVKRFKEISIQNTDLEVREQGIELLRLDDNTIGLVTEYQNIPLYEAIDFEKPVRGMQVGMMPAKLTQTLMSIAVSKSKNTGPVTVWDPFCGFGTTGFVANAYGYNFIGSDINPTPTKQNLPWWGEQSFKQDAHFTVFKHDVKQPFTQPFLQYVSCIVTEGRLGPVMSTKAVNQLDRKQLNERREAIEAVYCDFLDSLQAFEKSDLLSIPMVITYPQRTFTDENLSTHFVKKAQNMGYTVEQIGNVYTRKGQNVGRRILLLTK